MARSSASIIWAFLSGFSYLDFLTSSLGFLFDPIIWRSPI